jgi:hypothetical protein
MMQSCTCFPHVSKIQTLKYNLANSLIIKNAIILNSIGLHSISNLSYTEWQLRGTKSSRKLNIDGYKTGSFCITFSSFTKFDGSWCIFTSTQDSEKYNIFEICLKKISWSFKWRNKRIQWHKITMHLVMRYYIGRYIWWRGTKYIL